VYASRRMMLVCSNIFLAACMCPLSNIQAQAVGTRLRIGLITTPDSLAQSAAKGIRLGAAEAKQTAQLFSSDVELVEASGSGDRAVAAAASLLSGRQVQVLIVIDPNDADRISRLAESSHVVFLNVSSRSATLRSACRRYTFHVEATDAMYGAAQRLASASAIPPRSSARRLTVLWAPTLTRFGASELNKRFQAAYRAPMDAAAWAGWMAVKIVSEAALRSRSASPGALLHFLDSPATQFDGHKGWPLSFRQSEHQLRQPLYVAIPNSGSPGTFTYQDVPDLRALNAGGMAGNAERLLDRLSANSAAAPCSWSKSR
jgi:ABC-type branched-subunit amino acid transport system substrate-binding protein